MIATERLRNNWQSQEMVDGWKLIFSDLITLLVTMFVLFLSMNSLRTGVVDAGTSSRQTVSGQLDRPPEGMISGQVDGAMPAPGIGNAGAWIEQAKHSLARDGLGAGYMLHMDGRGLVLRFTPGWMRADGSLTDDGQRMLGRLAAHLVRTGSRVTVTQVGGGLGASWQDIADRARRVGHYLTAGGVGGEQVMLVARRAPNIPRTAGTGQVRYLEFVIAPTAVSERDNTNDFAG